MKRCSTLYCLGTPNKYRTKCTKCRTREWREKNPVRAAYINWRNNARRRGKHFAVTFEYFVQWCNETNYIALKGVDANSMTIDCTDDYVGYIDGGFTMKTKAQNSKEGKKGKIPKYKPDDVPF